MFRSRMSRPPPGLLQYLLRLLRVKGLCRAHCRRVLRSWRIGKICPCLSWRARCCPPKRSLNSRLERTNQLKRVSVRHLTCIERRFWRRKLSASCSNIFCHIWQDDYLIASLCTISIHLRGRSWVCVMHYPDLSIFTFSSLQRLLHNLPSKPVPQIRNKRVRTFDSRKMPSCLMFLVELNIRNRLHPVYWRHSNLFWEIADT